MLRTTASRYVACLAILTLIGCRKDGAKDPAYTATRALCVNEQSSQANALWTAAKDVLRDHGFRLDRVDRRAGVLDSFPLTSGQIFEFWRKDVYRTADAWEATLNPIRRWVEIRFAADETDTWRGVSVVVHKQRFSSRDRQFNSTGATYQLFGSQLPSTTGGTRIKTNNEVWLDQGRDPALEDHLVRAILERAGGESVLTPAPTAREEQISDSE